MADASDAAKTPTEIDEQLIALTNERDKMIDNYKQRIGTLRSQREAAIAQEKVAAMTSVERESLRQALDQTITPESVKNDPQVKQPEGSN